MKGIHQLEEEELNELYKAILKLKDKTECADFFRDLCTHEELVEMSKRWKAARMLSKNKSYIEVSQKTGLSTTTVARVAHWLNNGAGGYKLALKRLHL